MTAPVRLRLVPRHPGEELRQIVTSIRFGLQSPAYGPSQANRPQGAGGDVDDEGAGDVVSDGEGDGDGAGDFDGRGEDDVERKGAGEVAATRDGTVWPGVGTLAEN